MAKYWIELNWTDGYSKSGKSDWTRGIKLNWQANYWTGGIGLSRMSPSSSDVLRLDRHDWAAAGQSCCSVLQSYRRPHQLQRQPMEHISFQLHPVEAGNWISASVPETQKQQQYARDHVLLSATNLIFGIFYIFILPFLFYFIRLDWGLTNKLYSDIYIFHIFILVFIFYLGL